MLASELMTNDEESAFRYVHWMPGGKRVSYLYKDAVYSLDAPDK